VDFDRLQQSLEPPGHVLGSAGVHQHRYVRGLVAERQEIRDGLFAD
jgi:hypothetical protein